MPPTRTEPASFGFLEARHTYVRGLDDDARDRYYAEGRPAALLYGATGAPRSQAELHTLFEAMQPKLEPSDVEGLTRCIDWVVERL